MCRVFSSSKALVLGEDFTSDPVTRTLGIGVRIFSGGQFSVDQQSFSQVLRSSTMFVFQGLVNALLVLSDNPQKLLWAGLTSLFLRL